MMRDEVRRQVLGAFFVVMRPMARMLLRLGIGFHDFAEVAKTAFVEVASSDYGIRGRPTNVSRIAVMTGLTRKEVKRIRDSIASNDVRPSVRTTPLCTILYRWHAEEAFLDDHGRPAPLPFSGTSPSFSELVRQFGGDIPPGAMRTELKRVGAVREEEDGTLTVLRRYVIPDETHDNLIAALAHSVYPLLVTIAHNVNTTDPTERWTQQTAFTRAVKSSAVPKLRRICADRLMETVVSADDLFVTYDSLHEADSDEERSTTIAVGAFYFEDTEHPDEYVW